MKVIDKVFIDTTYRKENYDRHDFEYLQSLFNEYRIVCTDATLLCGKMQYCFIENLMLDYMDFNMSEFDVEYRRTDGGHNVFNKNGRKFYLKLCNDLPEWTMISIPEKVDLRKQPED